MTASSNFLATSSLNSSVLANLSKFFNKVGFEVDLFTPIFVAGRSVGWAAHYFEQREQDTLIRPAAKYIGIEERD